MAYSAYITRIKNVKKHSNADRLQVGTCFGNQVIVGMDTKNDDIGVYFPTDGALSPMFLKANDLIPRFDETGVKVGGGFFDVEGRVRTQRFRGEKSDGFFGPLSMLGVMNIHIGNLKEGMSFTEIEGKKICEKYINPNTRNSMLGIKQNKKIKEIKFPTFHEHIETYQLTYDIDNLKAGMTLVITEKLHGTSQRTGYLQEVRPTRFGKIVNWLTKRKTIADHKEYKYICGSRKVVIKDFTCTTGYYGDAEGFRQVADARFEGKLNKGETVYYEIVGWANDQKTIMGKCDNKKVSKEFVKEYGAETIFHYGCEQGKHEIYIYRMSMTNEDGFEVDYTWDYVRERSEKMCIPCVPTITKIIYNGDKQNLIDTCEKMVNGNSSLAPHIKEGVVVRVDSSKWIAMKYKSFEFKVLEGICKSTDQVDIEESQ